MLTRRLIEDKILDFIKENKSELSLNDVIKKMDQLDCTKTEENIYINSFENGVFNGMRVLKLLIISQDRKNYLSSNRITYHSYLLE